jgi:hypothetical protein
MTSSPDRLEADIPANATHASTLPAYSDDGYCRKLGRVAGVRAIPRMQAVRQLLYT